MRTLDNLGGVRSLTKTRSIHNHMGVFTPTLLLYLFGFFHLPVEWSEWFPPCMSRRPISLNTAILFINFISTLSYQQDSG